MTILYLHGMASSHACPIAQTIQQLMPEDQLIVPDLSIDPNIAFPQIDKILRETTVDLIIGHSLGGFMAQKYRGYKKILINPSLGMSYMYLFRGDNRYKQPRQDGNTLWHVTTPMCEKYKQMEATEFDGLTADEDRLTMGFFGRRDLFTRLSAHRFKQHYSHRVMMPGSHYPTPDTILNYIVPAIRMMRHGALCPEVDNPHPQPFTRPAILDLESHQSSRTGSNNLSQDDYLTPGRDAQSSIDGNIR